MRLGLMATAALCAVLQLGAYQAKQPKAKSKKELEAINQVVMAQQKNDAKGELDAITNVLESFADTEFKPQLLQMALQASQQTGDPVQVATWAQRTMDFDPKSIEARVTLAETTASQIRENDLDKADNIKKVNDLAQGALDLIKAGGPPPAGIAEDKWPDYKKYLTARAWGAIAMAAAVNKKPADSVAAYKNAAEADPNSVVLARLSRAYLENKQYDEAIATADKSMAMPDANQQVKAFAQQQKDLATKLKGAK